MPIEHNIRKYRAQGQGNDAKYGVEDDYVVSHPEEEEAINIPADAEAWNGLQGWNLDSTGDS